MLFGMSEPVAAALVGLGGGIALGLAARIGRFCTLGAIEDFLYQGSDIRMRMWGVAIGVAVIGTQLMLATGLLLPETTLYLGAKWWPVASIAGGLLFGYGMALAGNCGFGALARLGGGDLRSFVIVMVMGLSAYVTLSGPLARLRVWAFPQEPAEGPAPPGIAHGLAHLTGLSVPAIGLALGIVILAVALASRAMRARPGAVFWGVVVGLAVAAAGPAPPGSTPRASAAWRSPRTPIPRRSARPCSTP
jgi:Predicted transporter component